MPAGTANTPPLLLTNDPAPSVTSKRKDLGQPAEASQLALKKLAPTPQLEDTSNTLPITLESFKEYALQVRFVLVSLCHSFC